MSLQLQSAVTDVTIEHAQLLSEVSEKTSNIYMELQCNETTTTLTQLVDTYIDTYLSMERGSGIKKFEGLLLVFSILEFHREFQEDFVLHPGDIEWYQKKKIELSKAIDDEEKHLFKKGFKDTFNIGTTPLIGDQWGFLAQITENIHSIFSSAEKLQ